MLSIYLFLVSPLLKWVTVSGLIGAGGVALYLLTPAWFPARFRNAAGIVGIAALVGGAFYWMAFHAGEKHMAQRIAAQDQEAVNDKDAALKDVHACRNRGGTWDVTVGVCR
jgi:thiol:disulfide interchange protein